MTYQSHSKCVLGSWFSLLYCCSSGYGDLCLATKKELVNAANINELGAKKIVQGNYSTKRSEIYQMTIEQERKSQCFKENCQYFLVSCIRFHGYGCSKLGGTKIPTLMSLSRNTSIQGQGHSMKPKFLDGGNVDDDREECEGC